MSKFLRTTAFRIALAYLVLFVGSVLLLFAVIYTGTVTLTERQTGDIIAAEIRGLEEQYGTRGLTRLAEVIAERSDDEGDGVYLLVDARGRSIAGNLTAWPEGADTAEPWSDVTLLRRDGASRSPHAVRVRTFVLPGDLRLLVGRDVQAQEVFKKRMIQAFSWSLVLIVGLGLLGGWFVARRMLARVDAIGERASAIVGGDLSGRIAQDGSGDEFDRLSARLNEVLERNEQLLTGMRLVTDSMAHDLKGPLTRLKARIELALREPQPERDGRGTLADILAEAERALALFDGLIRIAEAESGISRSDFAELDLCRSVQSLAELYEPVAEERSIRFEIILPPALPIRGHGELISQAVANILDNALKYTPAGGIIAVRARALDSGGAELSITDSGPGIPAADRQRVLKRFERLDVARSTPGSGLGLSLVAAVARLHDARLSLSDAGPGLTVTLTFPA